MISSAGHWNGLRDLAARAIPRCLVLLAAFASGQGPSALQFKITRTGIPVCYKNVVRVPIVLTVSNPTDAPLVIGRVAVVRDSFYRKGEAALHPLRDNPVTEEFAAPDSKGLFQRPEQHVWPHSTKQIQLERPIAIKRTDIQRVGRHKFLMVSFLVSNMQHGSG